MLSNLRTEMIRCGVTLTDLARVTGKTDRCMRDKVSGKRNFTFPECTTIRDAFFQKLSLEYLFAQSDAAE